MTEKQQKDIRVMTSTDTETDSTQNKKIYKI